ncbi:DUF2934 domain-containing protein [Sinorhizobium sp. RAC02]|uniref:DUF2934 domain-containing protein n=1 Tax=Sinorhizobium sp. RAC02 TaxID=1842534 RepID=UPI00083D0310|nr:DUF2934 domain-containing protein [Sinorhizobium sp. RAC02]AOF94393.1 hypothetical protein BSY16_4646 [Sinorhizobium sp. RAC02]
MMTDERERRITARAFELWQREGCLDGRSLAHWLQAEKEVDDEVDELVAEDRTDGIRSIKVVSSTH